MSYNQFPAWFRGISSRGTAEQWNENQRTALKMLWMEFLRIIAHRNFLVVERRRNHPFYFNDKFGPHHWSREEMKIRVFTRKPAPTVSFITLLQLTKLITLTCVYNRSNRRWLSHHCLTVHRCDQLRIVSIYVFWACDPTNVRAQDEGARCALDL